MLAGAVAFLAPAMRSAAVALGARPSHGVADTLANLLLTPLLSLCAVPLVDGAIVTLHRGDRAAAWTRVMVEATAALVVAVPACLYSLAAWPGVGALALAGGVGLFAGFLRWRPAATQRRPRIPLLLLFDDAARAARERQPALETTPESEAA